MTGFIMNTQRLTNLLLVVVAVLLFAMCLRLYGIDVVKPAEAANGAVGTIYGCSRDNAVADCHWTPVRVSQDGRLVVIDSKP
jgi:hypothetical protein